MNNDIRFTAGLLNITDASHYLELPAQTFRNWALGYSKGGPLFEVLPAHGREARVTFISLAEAYVLKALRQAGVKPHRIRPALTRLQQEFGREHVLVSRALATDGIDVLWDFSKTPEGEGLIVGSSGQRVMREIVEDYLRYLSWADDGYPQMMQLRTFEPEKVVIDPHRCFGQPFFVGSGTRVGDAAAMLRAGEDPEVISDELGISIDQVRASARVLLGRRAA